MIQVRSLVRRTAVALGSMLLGVTVLTAPAAAEDDDAPPTDRYEIVPQVTPGSDQPAPKPGEKEITSSTLVGCEESTESESWACLEETSPRGLIAEIAEKESDFSGQDIVPLPQDLCLQSAEENGRTYGRRTQACQAKGLTYTTRTRVNGTTKVTGQAQILVLNYAYSVTDQPVWGHQIEASMVNGWGDARKAKLSGIATSAGKCTTEDYSFPSKALEPAQSWIQGEAYFETTATAVGAIGTCQTFWTLTLNNPPYTPDTPNPTYGMDDIRCDNDTGGRWRTIGCVVPWYASALYYSTSLIPQIASHVSRAQQSGLPGATFDAPLTRTKDPAIINANRGPACGDAPSIKDQSCDEYPLATSHQGLSAGGTRRTFDGCSFNLPRQTGPTGVSVCMVSDTEQNAQGGLNAGFYTRERVLENDPFRVIVVNEGNAVATSPQH